MKVKNIVFSGVMGAILMGATGASAAISVASQGYVDSKVGAVSSSVTNLETSVSNTYQTKEAAEAAATATTNALANKVETSVYDAHLTAQQAIDEKQTEDISKNAAAIATLNGDENVTGSVKNEIKVLSDLLGNTTGDVSGLTTQVGANKTAIEKLNAEAATVGSVANSIAEALKSYSTTEQVDEKDATVLQSAKDYADGLAGNYETAGAAASALADAKTYAEGQATAAQSAAKDYTDAEVGKVDAKLADYTKTSDLDAGFVTETEMTTFKTSNTEAIADAKKAGTDAQATANENAGDISQLQTDLATKITKPEACNATNCVLSITGDTISWVPLTEPVDDYLTE